MIKNKILTTCFIAGFMGVATNANAILIDMYAGAGYGIGRATFSDTIIPQTQSTTSYSGLIGIDIPLFRADAEYEYTDGDSMKYQTAMVNGYFKIPTPVIKPYIGAGAGLIIEGDTFYGIQKFESEKFIYQAMAGITVDVAVIPFDVDVEGRIRNAANIYIDPITNDGADLLQMDLRAKIRYIF